LSFANSSGETWAGGATLMVSDWNGNPSGGGAEQLKFGNSASGLTSSQLSQIVFNNPAGFPSGTYPAKILPTGEVVPVASPQLEFTSSGGALTLRWGTAWFLQSATNVAGPYQDVSGATSPYPAPFTGPQRFFRLR